MQELRNPTNNIGNYFVVLELGQLHLFISEIHLEMGCLHQNVGQNRTLAEDQVLHACISARSAYCTLVIIHSRLCVD